MNNWEQVADMVVALAVASLAWISSAVGLYGPTGLPAPASASTLGQDELGSVMRWAQEEDEPPIEQVGEDTQDVETLDEETPQVEEGDPAEDVDLLDQGPPAGTQDDVELLDQGPSPAPAAESTGPSTVTTEPVTTYVAPAATSGPFVPEGFGTGNVHVATGAAGFPIGLEDCHVGAVTGRAYVGIDCGDDGENSFVGHAPTFEEFPFVVDESFPFGQESVFANRSEGPVEDYVEALISAAWGTPLDADSSAPVIRTTGGSSVELEQRARSRKPRVESENGRAKRGKETRRGRAADDTSTESQSQGDQASVEAKQKAKKREKDSSRPGTQADGGKKAKDSKQRKNQDSKKDKKSRTPI